LLSLFFLYSVLTPRALPSFPTRRSSDLRGRHGVHRLAEGGERERVRDDDGTHLAGTRHSDRRPLAAHRALAGGREAAQPAHRVRDRKSTRLNSSHLGISYAVFCLKKKKK